LDRCAQGLRILSWQHRYSVGQAKTKRAGDEARSFRVFRGDEVAAAVENLDVIDHNRAGCFNFEGCLIFGIILQRKRMRGRPRLPGRSRDRPFIEEVPHYRPEGRVESIAESARGNDSILESDRVAVTGRELDECRVRSEEI